MFKELFIGINESRSDLKKSYLTPRYSLRDVEDMIKKAGSNKTYVQYPEPRSRGKIGGGEPKVIKGKIFVVTNFGDTVEVKPEDISMLNIIKG